MKTLASIFKITLSLKIKRLDFWIYGRGSSPHPSGYSEREKMDFFNFSPFFFYDHIQLGYPTLRFLFWGLLIYLLHQSFNFYVYLAGKCVQMQSICLISTYLDMLPYKEITGTGNQFLVNELFYRCPTYMPIFKTINRF